jgi:hypothetical protein
MKNLFTSILVFLFLTFPVFSQITYNYTGSMQTYVVPPCITSVTIEVYGGEGANSQDRLTTNATGGRGAYATGTLTVTGGQTLYIYVGGQGNTNGTGGFNGGGTGGTSSAGSSCFGGPAGGGGGASDVRSGGTALSNRVIVGGGGGGSGRDYCNGTCQPCGCGGSGGAGALNGINGNAAFNCGYSYPGTGVNGGAGGSQSAGGNGGTGDGGGPSGTAGGLGTGGNGAGGTYDVAGGGGGGGYYGGGGGGGASSGSGVGGGGGGGGSSYIGGVTAGSVTPNIRTGNGMVVITPNGSAPAMPGAISGNNPVCAGSTHTYTISTVPLATSYTWTVPAGAVINSGQGSTSINVTFGSTSGNISVYASNSCGDSPIQTLSVTVNPNPVASASGGGSICPGDSASLSSSGGTGYSWAPSGSLNNSTIANPIASPSTATTYTVTVSDANGCSATATVSVNLFTPPTISATTNANTVCSGSPANLSATGGVSYVWNPGNMTGSPITVNPMANTTYTVTGTDGNGCTSTNTVTVNVYPDPVISVSSNNDSICSGSTVSLSANGGVSYVWNPGNMTGSPVTVNPVANTTYTVVGTDGNGCTASNTYSIVVFQNPTVSALASSPSICAGDSISLTGSGAASYAWQPGNLSGTQVGVSPIGTTTYTVTGTDNNGCTGTATVTVVVNQNPTVTFVAPFDTVCLNWNSFALTGGSPSGGAYSGPGVSSGMFNPSVAGQGTHQVSYTYTDSSGCPGTATANIFVSACTGINEISSLPFSIFPNPARDELRIQFAGNNATPTNVQIELWDLSGKSFLNVFEKEINGKILVLDVSKIPNGIYQIRVSSADAAGFSKLVITR